MAKSVKEKCLLESQLRQPAGRRELILGEDFIFMTRGRQIMIARFPEQFRFQFTQLETNELVTCCDRFNNVMNWKFLLVIFNYNSLRSQFTTASDYAGIR